MKTPMKFEDLKLPEWAGFDTLHEMRDGIARAVWQQMRDHYERETAPAWRLPDPPPGQQWHRTDWTEDMLPEGYRPLLLGEVNDDKDEGLCKQEGKWILLAGVEPAQSQHTNLRTRRPLPEPEWVPLGPEDVQPGSAVRHMSNGIEWETVQAVLPSGVCAAENSRILWRTLFEHYEILRPVSTTWEHCKKPKP